MVKNIGAALKAIAAKYFEENKIPCKYEKLRI